jgi:transcriptional regulator
MKKADDNFDLPQGTLDLLTMRVVALGPIHGYAIAQRIQQMSRDALQVQQGSLYPALHRLEYKKFLVSHWKPSETGREAKFYELTAKGRTHLKAETESWARLTDVVGLILKGTLEGSGANSTMHFSGIENNDGDDRTGTGA